MTVSLCKHGFPVQPPHGSLAHPGPCSGCGLTWDDCQRELEEQETRVRAGTAAPGRCEHCGLNRTLFAFTEPARPWTDQQATARLCVPCWSDRQQARECGEFVDFADVFDKGTDEQLERFVGGRL